MAYLTDVVNKFEKRKPEYCCIRKLQVIKGGGGGGTGCAPAEPSLYIRPWIISFTFLIIGFLITAASQAICQQQFNLFVGLCTQIKLGTI